MTSNAPTSSAAAKGGTAKAALLFRVLCLVALMALGASYFTPAWWVALKAPNYPEHAFPDGVKINFHVDRVANGCELRASKEILEKEALDCVHEMDTINHFVGMYPIASGGPVEKLLSPFLFSFIGVCILGFAVPGVGPRLTVMGLGFAGVAVWMTMALYTANGVQFVGKGWVAGLVDSLGRSEDETKEENLHPVVKQLKESLAKSGIAVGNEGPKLAAAATKAQLVEVLKVVHDMKAPVSLTDPTVGKWTGRGIDVMAWHYAESLGRWFNEPVRNQRLVAIMTTATHVVYGAVLAAMLMFLWIATRPRSPLFLAIAAVPIILPIGFLAEYSAWLWWYGHSLNAMGAFTLKPFMPTVFGDGKVAQFSTHSYPALGFGLMMVVGVSMAVAVLVRRSLPDAAKD
ncbi:MAG: H-NS histone family protein [Siculibacillus sp.]|nr:H-NS histone family protein [Siculibacillus sp.]